MRRGLCTKFGALSAFALAIAAQAQPANDLCTNALVVGLGSTAFDTTGAGTEGPGATCGFGGATGQSDIFFRFTAPATSTYRVETCGGFAPFDDSIIQVLSDCAGTTVLGCNDDFCGLLSRVSFSGTGGTSYIIRVSGWGAGDVGPGTLTISEPPPAPPGDLCANATPVTVGSTPFNTTSANNDDTTNCGGAGPDIFYTFTSAAGGCFSFDTFGSNFDTILAVLESDCTTELICNDDSGGTLQSQLTFVAAPGVTYIIQVDGFGGASGSGSLNIAGPNPGPSNDLCANAIAVSVGSTAFNNSCAGTDGFATCGFGGDPGGADIWFTFQAPTSDIYRINTCQSGGLDTMLQVLDVCGGTEIACNDDACGLSSSVTFSATSGTTYRIRLAGWNGTQGSGIMTIGVPPPGDTCPTTLSVSLGSTAFNTTTFAGDDTTNCGGSGPDIFYNFTPPTTGCYQFDTFGSGFDTILAILQSDCATEIVCNDDSGGTLQSRVVATLDAGTTYVVQVDGFGGASGSGTLNISSLPPPANDTCATAATAVVGATAFSNICAQTNGTDSCGFGGLPGLFDVYFNFTAPSTGNYVVDTCGSNFDTMLVVADTCGGTELACNDDACGFSSSVTLALTGGTTYSIRIAGWNGAQGSGNLNISTVGNNPYSICPSTSAFENISSTGTPSITGNCDDCSENIPIGFSFNFFGGSFSNVFISSNGFLSFGVGSGVFVNVPIPSPALPNNIICPLWDDFNPAVQGDVYYQTLGTAPNRRLIVQWNNCIQFGASSGSNTFQVVLFEGSNNIQFRYATIDAQVTNDSTVGVEDATGQVGIAYDNTLLGTGNTALLVSTSGCGPVCDSIDFNNDGLFPDTQDVLDFISVFQGGPCSTGNCNDLDFNNDGLIPDTNDLLALLSVFQGGPCF